MKSRNLADVAATRRLRIAIFAPHFAEYANRLALALGRTAEVLLVTEQRNQRSECDGLAIDLGEVGVRHTTYSSDLALRRFSLRGWRESRRIHRCITAFRPDILHVQEQGDRFTASVGAAFSRKIPLVLTVHDPVPHSGNDGLVARRFARGLLRLRAAAEAYHVHGAYCETRLRQVLGPAKSAFTKPILATAHGEILVPVCPSPPDAETYLFFGRMEAYKGLETLLDAIDLLPRDVRFVVAGRGPELERCMDRIAAAPNIELIDRFLAPPDAITQFQRARAVLVPYRDATQSGVISAAFGNGRPVIATGVGGLRDAVRDGENGLLIPPDDPAALAGAIRTLADDSVARRLSAGAQAAAAGAFAWPAIAARLRSFYRQLLAEADIPPLGATSAEAPRD